MVGLWCLSPSCSLIADLNSRFLMIVPVGNVNSESRVIAVLVAVIKGSIIVYRLWAFASSRFLSFLRLR